MLEEIYNEAFNDELEKIAERRGDPVTLKQTFWAGFDPTGTATFKHSQKARRHSSHQLSGVAGGVIGGATILPSAVTGIVSAISKASKAGGGLRGKLLAGIAGFGKGIVVPYKQLYHGIRASRTLGRAYRTGKISTSGMSHVQKALGVGEGSKFLQSAAVRGLVRPLKKTKFLQDAHNIVKRQTGGAISAIGASAALGGGSSVLQYRQGRKVGDERRAGWYKTAGDYVEIGKREIASRSDIKAGKYKRKEPLFGRRRRARERAKMLNIIRTGLAQKD